MNWRPFRAERAMALCLKRSVYFLRWDVLRELCKLMRGGSPPGMVA